MYRISPQNLKHSLICCLLAVHVQEHMPISVLVHHDFFLVLQVLGGDLAMAGGEVLYVVHLRVKIRRVPIGRRC